MGAADHPHPFLQDGELSVRPSAAEDLDLLSGWFTDAAMYRWWGGRPLGRETVAQKYVGRRCPRVESFIIEREGEPIGYIQYHLEGPAQAGLDMILIPVFRERGIGPRVARLLLDHLVEVRGWTDITVDPARHNERAIRAWQKAGFTFDRDWPDHPDGPAVLMRLSH
jgi:aminoglycoside 6'-N-acetyltransferase